MSHTITLSAVDLLLRVSAASVGACESPAGTNAGPYVERVLKRTGNKAGDPWCMAQISDWGVLALGNQWPAPLTAGVMVLCDWAAKKQCRFVATKEKPQVGDILAVWFPTMKRWAHVALITAVNADGTVKTREGNTSGAGSREGWLVADRTRTLTKNDRLIRWTLALS